jgi:carnitine 3-dehydrogenase
MRQRGPSETTWSVRAVREPERFETVGILGGGLIGQSWASLFAARGAQVIVYDPDPAVGPALERFVCAAWPHLVQLGLAENEAPVIPRFTSRMEDLAQSDFVQENLPDRIEIKQTVLQALERIIRPETIIASSTSSLRPSDIQQGARLPGRILVAHPMNPPHLIPMVELVAGRDTAPETLDRAELFYTRMRRVPIRVKREVVGHLANRLTSALYREAVHMVAEGIADVADIDRAIANGPGLRWALMGPHLTYHLGGGPGGLRHYLDHLGPTQEARWRELGEPSLTPEVKAALIEGLEAELAGHDVATLTERRDAALVALLQMKDGFGF